MSRFHRSARGKLLLIGHELIVVVVLVFWQRLFLVLVLALHNDPSNLLFGIGDGVGKI